ncbi:hypothetical protein [Mesorhizobium sp.]|uniref:hypothetical protein n=1 Tax=Mesorhizobium sp. TaxID=1871066 RepID=UPI000FE9AE4A|nr:hypothetical protein [Mesorhizobium sp.]RWO61616.1 MAG: hypothetical protein EOS14_10370 [Mesorhizobium sp.]TIL48869.1 MAG: hypothetical protein E5Y83_28980 [Mesorhizobium sp.]
MSNLELREFHSFLERLIENSSREQRFSVDKIVNTVLSEHPQRLEKIQNQVIGLGLRALIRNNCRAKTSATDNGSDMSVIIASANESRCLIRTARASYAGTRSGAAN